MYTIIDPGFFIAKFHSVSFEDQQFVIKTRPSGQCKQQRDIGNKVNTLL